MNKRELVQAIIAKLHDELDLYRRAALAARAEATHEQSKAEHKYDTRGLEASYLARGQSKQAAEIEAAIAEFEKMPATHFGPGTEIQLGALVELKRSRQRDLYFIGPKGGGTEVSIGGDEVLVITPQSPLGEQLIGCKEGDRRVLQLGGEKQEFTIGSVS